jgi:hypothetical protein
MIAIALSVTLAACAYWLGGVPALLVFIAAQITWSTLSKRGVTGRRAPSGGHTGCSRELRCTERAGRLDPNLGHRLATAA